MVIAVTADIIGSRQLDDRVAAQRHFDTAIVRAEQDLPLATQPLRPTVGDEQQGVYPTLDAALASVLLIRLALPDGVEFRFGVGVGDVGVIPSAASREGIPEGPGWWAARSAIEHVQTLQRRAAPEARSWIAVDESAQMPAEQVRWANAYLLARDELVGGMRERLRRLTYGRCLGRTQRELAEQEGITQSAVSQALTAAGSAAVVEGFRLLDI
ncbi:MULTISPECIES: SatD family protein [unclassified Microbacterium]|uniref:SatD family protein n=1 Tax=unclassified Microbacterium TaxID=2609290 RepID=UPI0023054751|nr:SatD family protein [Microbacterium sp. nov. GSS16]WCD91789.1 SatD family protein [Microbacterium sp. nov. GSS16]